MFKTLRHTRSGDSGLRPIKRVTTENIKRHCAVQIASPSSSFLFLLFHFSLSLLLLLLSPIPPLFSYFSFPCSSSFLLLILSIPPLILILPLPDSTCSHVTLNGWHTQRHCRSCRTVTTKRRLRSACDHEWLASYSVAVYEIRIS